MTSSLRKTEVNLLRGLVEQIQFAGDEAVRV